MRAAVLGSPIGHSRSPVLHRAAYRALGLHWTYDAVELTPDRLAPFLAGLGPEWAGLSLTMPLKQTVLPMLDAVSPLAAATGSVNTVLLRPGERSGDNTDVAGIVAALAEAGVLTAAGSAVIGAGATAASALAALQQLGDDRPQVLVRDTGRAGPLRAAAQRLGVRPVLRPLADLGQVAAGLVVNTTPARALDALVPALPPVTVDRVLLDVVYAPWPTPLAQAFLAGGAHVVPGSAMLLHQAARQVELMTGRPAPLEQMRAALLDS